MAYKGMPVSAALVEAIRASGVLTVNVYPDCSPHAHGHAHRKAVGAYDVILSTKPFHPLLWKHTYRYSNACEFIPQGYDAALHLVDTAPRQHEFDVVMVASWREEYGRLMRDLARRFGNERLTVAIGGSRWDQHRAELPSHWHFPGGVCGRSYVELLRKGRVCIAPVTREILVDSKRQPGDVDSTRTYELAAAHCFFVHRRTDYALTIYNERSEVPMFDSVDELEAHIRYYLAHESARNQMATAAHRRAVPAYSLDTRAELIFSTLHTYLSSKSARSHLR
jgi:hypothetical protein